MRYIKNVYDKYHSGVKSMRVKYSSRFLLRAFSIAVLVFITIVFLVTVLFVNNRILYKEQLQAVNGMVSLAQEVICAEPVYLNGKWEAFDGVVCSSEEEVAALGAANEYAMFPISGLTQASKNATYRLKFSLPTGEHEPLMLMIPNIYKSADVYLNGVKQEYIKDGQAWLEFSTLESLIPLKSISRESEWQELVITSAFDEQTVTLYKRPVLIGTMKNLSSLAMFTGSNEMFLFGLLLLILINGYVFMMFRPNHKIISAMTLFDTMILMRSALSMNYVIAFAKDIFPWLIVSDRLCASFELFFLMLGGMVGCKLSGAIYDPHKRAPKWLIEPVPWIYLAFAFIFPLNIEFFEGFGKYMLFAVYGITFIGVFIQYRLSWSDKKRRIYNVMQFIKTVYIGLLVFIDILFWDSATNLLLLFYLYSVFFLLHVVVRLYDNNQSYKDVELLNTSLEDTVKKRTHELSEANKILSELSIRDPLTKIFNRLYFERAIESAAASFSSDNPIHLSILDLDFFKRINDTYGHNVGDDQLKSMTRLVTDTLGDKAVFARLGGEEFVLLFVGVSREDALSYISQAHMVIEADAKANPEHTTASFGVASFFDGDTAKQLLKRADVALYEAKRLGRNIIVTNFDDDLSVLNSKKQA